MYKFGHHNSFYINNRLSGLRTYLAGPVDRCPNGGIEWRANLTPFLENLGLIVLNPTNKPIDVGNEDLENKEYKRKLKENGDFSTLSELMKQIIKIDLRLCDIADFAIVFIDMDIFMYGTIHETILLSQQRKPILFCCKQGIKAMPDWIFGLCNYKEFFNDWTSLKKYLLMINCGSIEPSNRWLFFNKEVLNV